MTEPHRIIVVGGGAGGLELVTRLGKRYRKNDDVEISLVDLVHSHIWKPLLHEVASGTLNSHDDELSYLAQGHWSGFQFRLGALESVDRAARTITLAPSLGVDGEEYIPRRRFGYDTLVLALGSVTNDFGTAGVAEHCFYLDSREQADLLVKTIKRRLAGKPLPVYRYRDFGSLINLAHHSTVGNLMGNLTGKFSANISVEGWFARMAYLSLYKSHQFATQGLMRTLSLTVANWFTRSGKPRLKLH